MKRKKTAAAKRPKARPVKSAGGLKNPHVLKGLQYAEQVAAGEIAANRWVRLACQRQLGDLQRGRTEADYPYRFDEDAAGRAAEFFELLPHTQGPMAFEREDGSWNTLVLEPWQCFIITTVYGWIRKDSPVHRPVRRFSRVYEEVPRGNGKSFKLSGGLLYAFAEGEQGVEAYSAAVDREQASKVYGEAAAMLRKSPGLKESLALEQTQFAIFQRETNSKAMALSREAKKSGDGKNIYFATVDELHAHPTREVWDVLDTGTGKRGGNALIWIITTAGFDTAGVCYEKRDFATKILEGVVQDDAWFVIIYGIDGDGTGRDGGDRWEDEECRAVSRNHSHPGCVWRKANPNWGVSVDPVDFESKMNRAMTIVSEQNGILTKHLDVWCNADVAWMSMQAWDACAEPSLREEEFAGQACTLGIDLASKTDIAAKSKVFHRDFPALNEDGSPKLNEDGTPKTERHFYHFVNCYLPEDAVREGRNSQYEGWAKQGWIQTTPGAVLDFDVIEESVKKDRDAYRLREVAFDPAQATQLCNNLLAAAVPMVEMRPLVLNFSEPMKEWEALVLQGRWHHNGNPAMRWMVSNVICHRDAKDNIYPRKLKPENKIDGPVATIMALNRALLAPAGEAESYLASGPAVMLR